MDSPNPEDLTLLAKVVAAASAVIVPSWAGWNWFDKRFARKQAVNSQFQVMSGQIETLRSTQAKIFDQIRENEQRAQDRHERILERLPR